MNVYLMSIAAPIYFRKCNIKRVRMNIIEMPSNRNSQAPRGHDEPQQLWSEESIMDNGDSVSSESGEDDSGSECEMSVLCRVNQEIWEESSIWDELHVSNVNIEGYVLQRDFNITASV